MEDKKKICFVVQRYGKEIVGGAEALCMQYIERLKPYYEIDVATSCARDYNTWANEYEPRMERIDGVEVYRFPVAHPRRPEVLDPLTRQVYSDPNNDMLLGAAWLKEVGPYCPRMLSFIEDCRDYYDAFIFVGYHYFNSTFGMPLVPEKAVFIPTAHDEEPIKKCNYFRMLFHLPRSIVYMTDGEREFVQRWFRNGAVPGVVAGVGIETAATAGGENKAGGPAEYIVYAGRIDRTKNCDMLLDYFARFQQERGKSGLQLLLMGEALMEIPQRKDILNLGFVSEEVKRDVMRSAAAFVMPSENESLSIVTLEAMAEGTPVLVNGGSDVLRRHVEQSGAGLCFEGYDSFRDGLQTLLQKGGAAREMGEMGKAYVKQNYRWESVVERLREAIETGAGNGRP